MITGKWHKKDSAAQTDAALYFFQDGHFTLEIQGEQACSGDIASLQVSDRLGNVVRKLTFEDGSVFSTSENDIIDEVFKPYTKKSNFIHTIESKLKFVAIALVVTIAVTFSFFKWGLPVASNAVANILPQKTGDLIGQHSLDFLDEFIFEESRLEIDRQEQIREHFMAKIVPLEENKNLTFTLHFRNWSGVPNAFALPSGDIILTDAFVKLSRSQNEIDSVLLHEMAHVVHRHSLKMLVQSSLLTIVIMMTIGDVSAVADLGVGLGLLLLSSDYSRSFETEADLYAFEHMLQAEKDPVAFAQIMNRLSEFGSMPDITDHSHNTQNTPHSHEEEIEKEKGDKKSVFDYFSTHPPTQERIDEAEKFSACFKQGLKVCK